MSIMDIALLVKRVVEEEFPDKGDDRHRHHAERRQALLPHQFRQDPPRARLCAQAHDRGGGARPLPRLQGRQASQLMADDIYYNVRTHEEPPGRMSDKPVAVVTGGAGFIGSHMVDLLLGARLPRARDRQSRRRPRGNLAHHAGEPRLAFERRDIRRLEPGDALFKGADLRLPFRRHRRHRAFDRAADRLHGHQRPGHRARARMRARGEGRRSSSMRRRRPATASPPCRPAKTIRSRPSIPMRCSKYLGETGGVSLAPGLSAAGQLDPHLQCLRPARAHHGRLWGGVRRLLQAEARRQAVHGGRRRHAAARLSLRDRRRRGVPARGRKRLQRRAIWNLGAGNPQSVNRLVELLGGDGRPYSETAGRARLHLGGHRQDHARSRLEAGGAVRGGRQAHDGGHRALARRAAVGPAVDRGRHQDLVSSISGREA